MKSKNDAKNEVVIWGFLISSTVAVIGWFVINDYNVSRDIENKKRELTTEYLINAYRVIETFAGSSASVLNDPLLASNEDIKRINDLEQAIADIQLFGNSYQRKEIARICEIAGKGKEIKINNDLVGIAYYWESNKLLLNLRKELRKELGLEEISSEEDDKGIWWLRWSKIIEETKKINKFLEINQPPKEK